jgi:hypothetical protein
MKSPVFRRQNYLNARRQLAENLSQALNPPNPAITLQHLPVNRRFAMMPKAQILFLLAGIFTVFGACGPDRDQLVRAKAAERDADFRRKKLAECEEGLLLKAEKIVDSLLLHEALDAVNDSLMRLRPYRPVQPPTLDPIDSAGIAPIFPKQ